MPVAQHNLTDIERLRAEMRSLGQALSKSQSWDVLRTVKGHYGVAVDALLMTHRPEWLEKMVPSKPK